MRSEWVLKKNLTNNYIDFSTFFTFYLYFPFVISDEKTEASKSYMQYNQFIAQPGLKPRCPGPYFGASSTLHHALIQNSLSMVKRQ